MWTYDKSLHKHHWESRRNSRMANRRSHVLNTKSKRDNKPKKLRAYYMSSNIVHDPHFHHCRKNTYILNWTPTEQKGCKKESYGCKDRLLTNEMILEECKTKEKNLSTARVDCKKAFDRVPSTWITKCLQIYKICPVIVMKEKVRKEYYRRIRLILKSELNSGDRFEAINTLAVPVVA